MFPITGRPVLPLPGTASWLSGLVWCWKRFKPAVVVFDGTWPFQGFMVACKAYGVVSLVWSNRGLFKGDTPSVPVDETAFDLIIQPGELNSRAGEAKLAGGGKKIIVPPVCLLENDELLDRDTAREKLGLSVEGRYVLFSLGPGNMKDVAGIGHDLIRLFTSFGMQVVWARPPISIRDVDLPSGVIPISCYPLVRYMRAFDGFVGAAGYNTCCEVVQTQIPSLLVPNVQLADDQLRRAQLAAEIAPVVISACETDGERRYSVEKLLGMITSGSLPKGNPTCMDGAAVAAVAIAALALRKEQVH